MFTAGAPLPEAPEETREYETVAIEEAEPVEPGGEEIEPGEAAVEVEEFVDGEPGEEEPVDEEGLEDEVLDAEVAEDAETLEVEDDLEEIWEEDEYDEWDEEPVADEADQPDTEAAEGSGDPETPGRAAGEDLKAWFAAFSARSRTLASKAFGRIGQIRIPRQEIDGQKAMAAGGILLIALLIGAGGYVLGKGSGDDIDQARLEGEFAGKQQGAIEGASRGYAAGFKKGRDLAFRKSYEASYRRNYIRAYENAGMDPPQAKNIEVPKP